MHVQNGDLSFNHDSSGAREPHGLERGLSSCESLPAIGATFASPRDTTIFSTGHCLLGRLHKDYHGTGGTLMSAGYFYVPLLFC